MLEKYANNAKIQILIEYNIQPTDKRPSLQEKSANNLVAKPFFISLISYKFTMSLIAHNKDKLLSQ